MPTAHQLPGYLVAIEGIDGAGKTTQAHFLQETLQARGLTVIRTKEPTTGKWGQMLRDSALTGRMSLDDEVEAFIADRKEHVAAVIEPGLRAGHVVIIDRYYFSNAAYQGARGIDPVSLLSKNEAFAPEPDLLVILDVDPKIGLQRIRMRGDRANHFEKTSTLRRAREIFISLNRPYLYRVDGNQDPTTIRELILHEFEIAVTERVAATEAGPQAKLNGVLAVFGGGPI